MSWDIPKSFKRLINAPLDTSTVFDSYSKLINYVKHSHIAYPGQIVSVTTKSRTTGYIINKDFTVSKLVYDSDIPTDIIRTSRLDNNSYIYEKVLKGNFGDITSYIILATIDKGIDYPINGIIDITRQPDYDSIARITINGTNVIFNKTNAWQYRTVTAFYKGTQVLAIEISTVKPEHFDDYRFMFTGSYNMGCGFLHVVGDIYVTNVSPINNNNININTQSLKVNNNLVWNKGNDGSGSGLDSDLLDGKEGEFYTRIIRGSRPAKTPLPDNTILITPDDKVFLNNSTNDNGGGFLGVLTTDTTSISGFDYNTSDNGDLLLLPNVTINKGTMDSTLSNDTGYGNKTPTNDTGAENLGNYNWFEASKPNYPFKWMSLYYEFDFPLNGIIEFGGNYHKYGVSHKSSTGPDSDCSILEFRLISENSTVLSTIKIKGQTHSTASEAFKQAIQQINVTDDNKAVGLEIYNKTGVDIYSDTCINRIFAYAT